MDFRAIVDEVLAGYFRHYPVQATEIGHHAHDGHPGFEAWNKIADAYQVGDPLAFGGETVVHLGISAEGSA